MQSCDMDEFRYLQIEIRIKYWSFPAEQSLKQWQCLEACWIVSSNKGVHCRQAFHLHADPAEEYLPTRSKWHQEIYPTYAWASEKVWNEKYDENQQGLQVYDDWWPIGKLYGWVHPPQHEVENYNA